MENFILFLFSLNRQFIALILFILLAACHQNQLEIDVSSVKIERVKIKRLEKDIFNLDTNNITEHSLALQKKYGSFFEKFVSNVINDGGTADSTYGLGLKRFLGDKDMNDVYKKIETIYTDNYILKLEDELTEAFCHIKFYFPTTTLPNQIITMMSGFNYGIVNVDSTLALGLDYYLGCDAPYYDMMQPPLAAYKKRLMDKEYLLADMIAGWVVFKFDQNEPDKNLLETMIKAGKLFYCTKAILPTLQDSILVGYSSKQMEYCNEYEKNLWGYFAEKDRLYASDMKEIVAYTTDGPFTAQISKECPPAIAKYIGYRIVYSYMQKNPQITVSDLMGDKDFQKILSKSKYKP